MRLLLTPPGSVSEDTGCRLQSIRNLPVCPTCQSEEWEPRQGVLAALRDTLR